jgi:1,4-dihydroxy-2-naphthoate octaprenyltransferase
MVTIPVLLRELRAQFLPASVLPVLLGTAMAFARAGAFDAPAFALTLAAVVLVHLGTNVSNDYFDHRSGNDEFNTQFVRPFTGGSRLIQEGLLSPRAVLALAIVLLSLAVAAGAALAATRGPSILVLGAIGIASGLFYVAPPFRFAARGVGEILIGINFGVLCVMGAYYVQTRTVTWESFVASLPLAVLIAAVVFINEFQDMEADPRAGKRPLVVRLGRRKASRVYGFVAAAAFAPVVAGVAARLLPPHALVSLAALPAALRAAAVARRRYDSPKELAPANALTILAHTLTGALLAAGYLLAR